MIPLVKVFCKITIFGSCSNHGLVLNLMVTKNMFCTHGGIISLFGEKKNRFVTPFDLIKRL